MYIHLGQGTVVRSRNVLGIFDLDSTTVSKHTRKFLEKAEKNGGVITVSYELPKSFAVVSENGKNEGIYFPACNLYPFKTVGFYRFSLG